MYDKSQRTALIVGPGGHLGGALARRFAHEGLHVVATRRRGSFARLQAFANQTGTLITTIHSDARDEQAVASLVDRIETQITPLELAVFNVGGNVRFGITETSARVYRKVWEMCAFGGFLVGREVAARTLARKRGTIIFTGATASVRGAGGYAAFAVGKHALRALAQSMARELGPRGIHVAHVVIDGPIESEAARRLFPDVFASRPADGVLQPDDLAEIYWQLHRQPPSAWSFETDVRTCVEPW